MEVAILNEPYYLLLILIMIMVAPEAIEAIEALPTGCLG